MKRKSLPSGHWRPMPDLIADSSLQKHWTPENPAEPMVAYFWCLGRFRLGRVLSINDVASWSGLSRRQAGKVLKAALADHNVWEDDNLKRMPAPTMSGTEAGQRRDRSETGAGQADAGSSSIVADQRDSAGTEPGQERDSCARFLLSTQTPDTPSAPEEPPSAKPDPARELWNTWEPIRAEVYGGRPGKLTRKRHTRLRAALREYSADDLARVFSWWLHCGDWHPRFLRGEVSPKDGAPVKRTWETILANLDKYHGLSEGWQGVTEDPEALQALDAVTAHVSQNGPRSVAGVGPRVRACLEAVGGAESLLRPDEHTRRRWCAAWRSAA